MVLGKGFGFWKTIPTRLRKSTQSFASRIDELSSRIFPSVLVPGIRSFIRFKQRKKVDLPHPEGPISAVTFLSKNSKLMS